MATPSGRRRTGPTGRWLAAGSLLLLGGLDAGAEPAAAESPGIEVVDEVVEGANRGAVFGSSLFRRRVEVAAREVRSQLRGPRGRSCGDYFAERGVDLGAWLALEGPPYVKEVGRDQGGRSVRQVHGSAQAGAPFEWVFIGGPGARSTDACRLGSLLLHELGHLARRDVTDNEPLEFFSRCRLSACIDAGRFR